MANDAGISSPMTVGQAILVPTPGVRGLTGEKGDTGPQGPQGAKGDQGIQGAQGPQGDPGPTGPQGIQGPTGPEGKQAAGLMLLGVVSDKSALPAGASKGDAWKTGDTGDVWTYDGAKWHDVGQIQGAKGSTGPAGPQGPQGPAGPDGKPGMVWQGAYSSSTQYYTNDVVYYAGQSWIARVDTVGNTPPTISNYNTWWYRVAQNGADGATGPAGPAGTTDYNGLVNVPATFPPSKHTHLSTDITDAVATPYGTTGDAGKLLKLDKYGRISTSATPSSANDVATKSYVDLGDATPGWSATGLTLKSSGGSVSTGTGGSFTYRYRTDRGIFELEYAIIFGSYASIPGGTLQITGVPKSQVGFSLGSGACWYESAHVDWQVLPRYENGLINFLAPLSTSNPQLGIVTDNAPFALNARYNRMYGRIAYAV